MTCLRPGPQLSVLSTSLSLETILRAGAGSCAGQPVGRLWESGYHRRGPSCPHYQLTCNKQPPPTHSLSHFSSACQEQAATWEEMPVDSLGVASKCQANSAHPEINSPRKDPDVWPRSKSSPWLSLHTLTPTPHGLSLTPVNIPTAHRPSYSKG